MSAPENVILPDEDVSEDNIEDSDMDEEKPQILSQDSHDTIESWSVV
jgi:hypothetical protein